MPRPLGESDFEEITIERLQNLDYNYLPAYELFQRQERSTLNEVVLKGRLEAFLRKAYPTIPEDYIPNLASQFIHTDGVTPLQRNEHFHHKMVKGIDFPYEVNNQKKYQHVFPIDWENPENNDFLVVNQMPIQGRVSRRPDIIVFVNGFPLIVFELKNPNNEQATVYSAYNQIRNYTDDISHLFNYNAFCVVSDNVETKHGMPFADFDYFAAWKTIDGRNVDNNKANTMKTLIEGLFPKERLLNYIKNFIVFMNDGSKVTKIGAKYHQFFGVQFAVQETIRATRPDGDRKIGVIWHTQGSGKSVSMLFYAGILSTHPQMDNPTIVIQVDRNDLDQQLHDTFVQGKSLIGHVHHAESTDQLRELLRGESGKIIFSTIEKFRTKEDEGKHPVLSERRNIVVIADEAHRTQYSHTGFAGYLRQALPNASHIAFTGTPIDLVGRNTVEVFGNIIHSYDMLQAVEDNATVPIYYESRLIPLDLDGEDIDDEIKNLAVQAGESVDALEGHKRKWAALAKVAGTPKRLKQLANDIVTHFNQVANPFQKAMIVCMTRENAVKLYNHLKAIPECPPVEVIMTGNPAKDPQEWRQKQPGNDYAHIKTKQEQEEVKAKLRDPDDPLKFVIVVDMWLTGMDAKPVSFLYVDKPMHGHNLMQAIARVNRVFPGKKGGVVADYIGIATQLKEATAKYTQCGGKGAPAFDIETAVALFKDQLEVVRQYVPEWLDITDWRAKPKVVRFDLIADFVNALLDEKEEEYVEEVVKLEKSYQLIKHLSEVLEYADELLFYQMVKTQVRKHIRRTEEKNRPKEYKNLDERLSQLVDEHITAKETVDIFEIAGIEKPDISILDEQFLADLTKKEHFDLRMKLLRKLLEDEIKIHFKERSPKQQSFKELLEKTLNDYHNRVIQAADVVRVMIEVKKEMDEEVKTRKELGLSEEEIEFYKAVSDWEHKAFSNEFLADLIHKVVKTIKKELKVDWTKPHRKDVYAKVKIAVKHVLMKENIIGEQLKFLTNRFLETAEKQYKDWPLNA